MASLSLASQVDAQKYVFNAMSLAAGQNPSDIATGDFNGDGRPDLAVVGQFDSTVSIYLAKVDGTFQPRVDYTVGTFPRNILAADLNGDGNLDLAITGGQPADTVTVLLGKGDGTFQVAGSFATGHSPGRAAAGDLNGDGKMDLVIPNASDASVSVLLGNGDGTFQLHVDYASTSQPGSPTVAAIADLNGDGKPDLIVANNVLDTLGILLGKGDGTFQTKTEVPIGFFPTTLGVADFNGDGKLDVAVNNASGPFPDPTNSITVLLGNGDGTFQPRKDYSIAGPSDAVLAGDFNGDGKTDLVAVGNTISVLLGKGDGTFLPHRDFGGFRSFAVVAADFNSDSHLDLALPNNDTATVNILLGDGAGAFGSIVDSPLTSLELFTGDFNGDGKLDLARTVPGNGGVSVLLGNGDGTFQAPVDSPKAGGGPFAGVGDFNGDGKLDIAMTAFGSSQLAILLGNGDGSFHQAATYTVTPLPDRIVTADFNKDGHLDVAFCGLSAVLLLGNGDGTFQVPGQIPQASGGPCIAADVNGDGNMDLLATGPNLGVLSVFLGRGDGTFGSRTDYAVGVPGSVPIDLVAADFNGDGKLDVAVADVGMNLIAILQGNGDGTFQAQKIIPAPKLMFGVRQLVAGDFTGDGKLDLAAEGNVLALFAGNGDDSFAEGVIYGARATWLVSGDFNGDGKPDLATAAAATSVFLSVPTVALGPSALTFAKQNVGTVSPVQDVTLFNPGIASLMNLSEKPSGEFAETSSCGASLAAGTSCTVGVTFHPISGGPLMGSLTITDDAPGKTQSVPLSGTGADFAVVVTSGASSSASISAGQTATFKLEVDSTRGFDGTVDLTCTGLPASVGVCTALPSSVTLNGSSASPFTVQVHTNTTAVFRSPRIRPHTRMPLASAVLASLAALALFLTIANSLNSKLRLQLRLAMPLLAAVLGLSLLAGCKGSGTKLPQTFQLTVIGTSNGIGRTQPVTLTITN